MKTIKSGSVNKENERNRKKKFKSLNGKRTYLETKKPIILRLAKNLVDPWGVEPQSKEPESFILSIELWVLVAIVMTHYI